MAEEDNDRKQQIERLNSLKNAVSQQFLSGQLQADPSRMDDIGALMDDIEQMEAALGLTPEMSPGSELVEDAISALPIAGGIAGGALSGGLGFLPTVGMAALGAAGGEGFRQVGEEAIAQSRGEAGPQLSEVDRLKLMAEEGAVSGAGELIGGGLIRGATGMAGIRPMEMIRSIKEAAKSAPGFKLGPAQRFDPRGIVGGAEAVLTEGKSLLASAPQQIRMRNQVGALETAIRNNIRQPDQMTAFEAGQTIKKNIQGFFDQTRTPLSVEYDALKKQFGDGLVSKEFVDVAKQRLLKVPGYKIRGSRARSEIDNIIKTLDDLDGTLSIDDVKLIRTEVGDSLEMGAPQAVKRSIRQANRILKELREDGIIDYAGQKMGFNEAVELAKRQADADAAFKSFVEEFKQLGEFFGKRRPKDVFDIMDHIDAVPEEEVVSRLFKKSNIKGLKILKNKFPDQFETMKDYRILQMFDKATDINTKRLSPGLFLKEIDKLEPETVRILLGQEKVDVLSNLKLLESTLPRKFNPSGTSVRDDFLDPLKNAGALIPALGTALSDNIVGRGVLRIGENPFVRTSVGQGSMRLFINALDELEIYGYKGDELVEIAEDQVAETTEKLMKHTGISSVEKAKQRNLLNRRGLLPIQESEADKKLSPRERKLKQFLKAKQDKEMFEDKERQKQLEEQQRMQRFMNRPIPSGGSF